MSITSSRMPDADAITYKEGFVKRYSELTDWDAFSEINKRYLRKSIRVNTLKITVKELLPRLNAQGWMTQQIPWCAEGFFVEHREGRLDIGNTLEHALGYIYVQEAASMIPPLALGVKPGSTALDLCAAPGSKTSQMAAMMKNTGALFANDTTPVRLASLGINLQRCGVANVCVTQMVGQRFLKLGPQFDYVLCDAPCSGTGTIRKSLKTLSIWNPKLIGSMAFVQKQLIKVAHETTKSGGTFVYSTCSLEPEENEEVVSWLLEQVTDVELEELDLPGLKKGKPVLTFEGKTYHPSVRKTLRLWPQDNDTEGFFVAKFRKK